MSNINNDLLFEFAENVNVILWMIYYKQQIVKNQKRMINFIKNKTQGMSNDCMDCV